MMRPPLRAAIGLAIGLGVAAACAAPALAAPCADDIAAMEARLKDAATSAISTSTASKEVSMSREAEAMQARNHDVPVTAMPHAPAPGTPEAHATERAKNEAGGGGDRVMQAKASLNRARTLDEKGDSAGCREAVAQTRKLMDE